MDVESILDSQGVDYTDHGKRFMVLCPFHNDHTPSGGLWADTGYFKCFACGVAVSFAEFLSEATDIPLLQARLLVRGADDITNLEDRIRKYFDADVDRFRYFNVKSFRSIYPPLEEGSDEWDYLCQRGIKRSMINLFDMRSGVRKYQNRVVLPIYTPEGRLVSYMGRAIDVGMAPKTRKSRSPHRTLFGLRQVVRKFSEGRLYTIVVVEGEFDAIYLQQFGISAVANMGTVEMSFAKLRLLRKYAKRVVLSYDGDAAGQTAMFGNSKRPGQVGELIRHVPTVSIVLPEGKDPNSLSPDQVEEIYGPYKD